jgi:hypothetical protein
MPPGTGRTGGHTRPFRGSLAWVVAKSPDIAHVVATSPTWAYRPIRAGCRPTSEVLEGAFGHTDRAGNPSGQDRGDPVGDRDHCPARFAWAPRSP